MIISVVLHKPSSYQASWFIVRLLQKRALFVPYQNNPSRNLQTRQGGQKFSENSYAFVLHNCLKWLFMLQIYAHAAAVRPEMAGRCCALALLLGFGSLSVVEGTPALISDRPPLHKKSAHQSRQKLFDPPTNHQRRSANFLQHACRGS